MNGNVAAQLRTIIIYNCILQRLDAYLSPEVFVSPDPGQNGIQQCCFSRRHCCFSQLKPKLKRILVIKTKTKTDVCLAC